MRHEPFDVDYASKVFTAEAKVNSSASYYNDELAFIYMLTVRFRAKISSCFHQLVGTNVALQVVDQLAAEAFG